MFCGGRRAVFRPRADAARAAVPAGRARDDFRAAQVFADAAAPAPERAGRRQCAGGFRHLPRDSDRHDLGRPAGASLRRTRPRPAGSDANTVAAIAMVVVAIGTYVCSRFIPRAEATDPNLKVNFNPVTATWQVVRFAAQTRAILNSLLGISWFWLVGALILAQLPAYAKDVLRRRQDGVHAAARGVFDRHRARLAGLRKTLRSQGRDRPGAAGLDRHDGVPDRPVFRASGRARRRRRAVVTGRSFSPAAAGTWRSIAR